MESEERNETYKEKLNQLNCETRKGNPESSRIKRLMGETFPGCWQWIRDERPPVSEILALFPPLKESSKVRIMLSNCIPCKVARDTIT